MQRREQELREKQEQLVQAAKLATLGELTTGVAHELNNPLNNIGLFIGNVIDRIRAGSDRRRVTGATTCDRPWSRCTRRRRSSRTCARSAGPRRPAASRSRSTTSSSSSLSLMQEQLRLREIEVELELCARRAARGRNPIQLEQVFINLLTNARDALADSKRKTDPDQPRVGRRADQRSRFEDTGPGHPARARAADLRPVLHHQGSRRGDRPRPVDHLRHRQGPRRLDLG